MKHGADSLKISGQQETASLAYPGNKQLRIRSSPLQIRPKHAVIQEPTEISALCFTHNVQLTILQQMPNLNFSRLRPDLEKSRDL